MAKNKKNESGLVGSLGAIGIGVGVLTITGQLWGIGLIVTGGFGMFMEFYKSMDNKFTMLLDKCGLCIKNKGKDTIFPTVIGKRKRNYGYDIEMALLPGLCLSDFKQCKEEFSQFFNADVEFSYNNNRIFIHVKEISLEKEYPFEIIETKKVTEVPLGMSMNGVETFTFNNQTPNLLIGGAVGWGKTTAILIIITFFIMTRKKEDLILDIVDLKGNELNLFEDANIVNSFSETPEQAYKVLKDLVKEMERRYKLLKPNSISDIDIYNQRFKKNKLPYRIIIIDEFKDLSFEKEIMDVVDLLARKGRASGIYILSATQRPDADTFPGRIKSNFVATLAFKCKNEVSSRILLDHDGASHITSRGRGILQTIDEKEIQCFYIDAKRKDEIIRPMIAPYCTEKDKTKPLTEVDTKGVVKNDSKPRHDYCGLD